MISTLSEELVRAHIIFRSGHQCCALLDDASDISLPFRFQVHAGGILRAREAEKNGSLQVKSFLMVIDALGRAPGGLLG